MQHLRCLVCLLLLAPWLNSGAALAGKAVSPRGEPTPARDLVRFDFQGELGWYYQNDVGMLLVYADGELHRTDLLAERQTVLPGLKVPDLSAAGSVIPIARTGLLLVPGAMKSGGAQVACAVDTLGNRILWERDPLPAPEAVFPYPEAGLAVIRSFDGAGSVYALDLATGATVWEKPGKATIIWARDNHIRYLSGSDLLTVDTLTGETVRTDRLEIPAKHRVYALKHENVVIFWKNKVLQGYSLPPAPPAPQAPAGRLWRFQAAGPMLDLCINGGGCGIHRVHDDLLMVNSARHHELIRIGTGERVLHVKYGMFGAPLSLSPSGRLAAVASKDRLRIHDATTEAELHAIPYPKGDEGMKTLKYLRWLDDETVMTVYPDKKGNPRKMSAFSAAGGQLLWTFVLPEVANYALTAEQRAKLIGRITLSLVATAVSASNPMSVGGTGYYAVFVPNLDVSETLDAAGRISGSAAGGETGPAARFRDAMDRADRVRKRTEDHGGRTHFVIGQRGNYEILEIDLDGGDVRRAVRFRSDKVHGIAPLTPLGLALAVENNNRTLRVIGLD